MNDLHLLEVYDAKRQFRSMFLSLICRSSPTRAEGSLAVPTRPFLSVRPLSPCRHALGQGLEPLSVVSQRVGSGSFGGLHERHPLLFYHTGGVVGQKLDD